MDREKLGQIVRQVWVEKARTLDNPKPSNLLPWEELDEWNQEVDRCIGEAVAMYVAKETEQSDLAMEIINPLYDLVRDFSTFTMKCKFWQDEQLAEQQALINRANRLLD